MKVDKMMIARFLAALAVICLLAAPATSMPHHRAASQVRQDVALSHPGMSGASPRSQIPPQMPIGPIHVGNGFALGPNNEPHLLRIMVEKGRDLRPSLARRLLREEKSIEEIRAEIAKSDETFVYRGHMLLGEEHYKLADINLIQLGNDTLSEADVAEHQVGIDPGGREAIVGHIKVRTISREGAWIGEGELVMDQGRYQGNYTVLLDMSPPRIIPPAGYRSINTSTSGRNLSVFTPPPPSIAERSPQTSKWSNWTRKVKLWVGWVQRS